MDRLSDVPGFRLLRHTSRIVAPSALSLDLIHRSAWRGNSPKFAAFRGFSGKLASPGKFIADSSALARVLVGWVSTF
jgi:hypothetical protein